MNNEDLLKKRFNELSNRAYQKGICTYTNFLNMNEISILKTSYYDTEYKLFGGYENAERCVCCFGDNNVNFPITCIEIKPLQQKFADKLSHRDFLGALMNLGIEREMLGDIRIKDNVGYLFCLEKIADYILDNLDRIKHTSVKCSQKLDIPQFLMEQPEDTEIIVSSLRVDVVIAAIFNVSRNMVEQLVNQEKVFINSKQIYKEAIILKENDVVSVRGYGKFVYNKSINETKKHKIVISVKIYKWKNLGTQYQGFLFN